MRTFILLLTLVAGAVLAAFVYRQAVVEGSFGPAAMFVTAVLLGVMLTLAVLTYLSGTRFRYVVANILVASIATVVTYAVLDLVLGWFLIVPLSPPLVPHPYRHHAMVPDSYAQIRQPDFDYIQRVNHLGIRGRETTVEKPAGVKRILMLGDSFTMGKGVLDDQTFSVLVEQQLQSQLEACGGGKIEVLNGGTDSYAPILSYLQFQRDLAPLSPDLVVLNFDNSDLIQEAAYRRLATRDANGVIIAVQQASEDSAYEQVLRWTSRHLFLTRALLVYVNRAMDHREINVRRVVNEAGREHIAHTLEHDVDRTAQWRDVFDSIGRIKQLADSMHAKFLLTTYPWAHQLNDTEWLPGRYAYMKHGEHTSDLTEKTIRAKSADLGIDLFEALPVFRAHHGTEPLYFKQDPHWTPAGHRVMAEGLAGYIAQRYLPDWCSSK